MTSYSLLIAMVSIFIIGCIGYFVSESKDNSPKENYNDADEYKITISDKKIVKEEETKKTKKNRRSKLTKI